MKNVFKLLAADSLIYGIGSALNGLAGFMLVPILIKSLHAAEYGRYALAEMLLIGLLVVFGFGLNTVLPSQYALCPAEKRDRLVGGILSLVLVFCGVSSFAFIMLMTYYGSALFPTVPPAFYWWIAAIAVAEAFWGILALLLRIENKPSYFVALSILQFLLSLTSTIYLLSRGGREESILAGRLFADAVVIAICAPRLRKYSFGGDWRRAWNVVKLGAVMMPATISTIWINMSPRFFLDNFGNVAEVGTYAMSAKIAGLLGLFFVQPFSMAWALLIFKIHARADARIIFAKALTYYWLTGLGLIFILGLAAPHLLAFLHNDDFQVSEPVIAIAALAIVSSGLMYLLTIGAHILNRTSRVVPVFVGSALAATVLSAVFTKYFGEIGAAAALVFVYAGQAIALGRLNSKIYPIQWEWRRIVKITLSLIVAYVLISQLRLDIPVWAFWLSPALFAILAGTLLFTTRFFEPAELLALQSLRKRISGSITDAKI